MDSREFVKKFSKITVKKACEKLGILQTNVSNGRTSDENFDRIKEEIESEFAKLYVKEK